MPTWLILFITVAGALFALKLLYVIAFGWTLPTTRGALFVVTSKVRIRSFLDAVPMNSGDLFVDLGCGDGRVLRAVRRRYRAKAVGFEVNPLAYWAAKILSWGDRGITILWRDFWTRHVGDADVVFCYLFPDVMERLADKLKRELKAGAWVVSCNFPLPRWRAESIIRPGIARHGDPIYVYRFPTAVPNDNE